MSHSSSRELIIRALKFIRLLELGKPVNSNIVAKELGINKPSGRQWLEAGCSVMPIYSPNEESRRQNEYLIYQLLK